ncbi:hypothetical protein [Cellulosimicrobium sp. NPDC055967]|uniref:hypothetical protein n=1 Tax=Cellulosimicrobium sp. NPDC055967 TaxID=3345670 RepID=UPI0035DFEDC1
MDLPTAIVMMNSTVSLDGRSDAALAAEVDRAARADHPGSPVKGVVTPAAGLGGAIRVRPVDAMLRLSRLTAPLIPSDVTSQYEHWGRLRYLGVFDRGSAGELRLGTAGRQVRGNQRRVMSEELGVGFGALLAEHWCRAQGFTGAIRFADVDQVLQGAYPGIYARMVAGRQPDYLIQLPSPRQPRRVSHRLLECKGTTSSRYAVNQLARAVTQLASLSVNGTTPTGIAVSTVSAGDSVRYLAVDPGDDEVGWMTDRFGVARGRSEKRSAQMLGDVLHADADDFFSSVTAVAMGSLADYAGSAAAVDWLPTRVSERLGRRAVRGRVEENELGVFEGQELFFPAPGSRGLLRIFQGVDKGVLDGIRHHDIAEVEESQVRVTTMLPEYSGGRFADSQDIERATSAVSPEGAMLSLTLVNGRTAGL